MGKAKSFWSLLVLLLLIWLPTCARQPAVPTQVPTAEPVLITPVLPSVAELSASTTPVPDQATPPPTQRPENTPLPSETATAAPLTISAMLSVPPEIAEAAQDVAHTYPDLFVWTDAASSDISFSIIPVFAGIREPDSAGTPRWDGRVQQTLAEWVYVAAAPFATVTDTISLDDVRAGWNSAVPTLGQFYVDGEINALLGWFWQQSHGSVRSIDRDLLIDTLWQERPAWTILPFHRLEPQLKVLRLEGVSPLDADFEPSEYLLTSYVEILGEPAAVDQFLAHYNGPTTNRDPNRLTFVAMTGPSGLDRAVGDRMERYGLTYPGEEIAPILAAADFAHMSNEVAFAPNCPDPEPVGDTQFCAKDEYLELMTFMSIDINEMTGNHVNDWGEHNLQHTFDLYEQAGILTFGGGRDLEQARAPLLIEHHGNRLAFVGCNPVGPYYAWAREGYGGSAPCEDYTFIKNQIAELDSQGYLVIATLQYLEHYQYDATGTQQYHFRALAEAGATAVSGSQGHHAQGFDFYAGAFIHYGLGNLIFDQMQYRGTRQSFIDWYVFYDGRLISVELITGLIEDYARPRLMTAEERAELLEAVFEGSGWGDN
jgi:hypothetical protein